MKWPFVRYCLLILSSLAVSTAVADKLVYSIHGLPESIETNVQNLLSIDLKEHKPSSLETVQVAYVRAPSIIRRGLEPFGYLHAQITSNHLESTGHLEWNASYTISLGPPIKITRLNIQIIGEGAKLGSWRAVRYSDPLKVGQRFSMKRYDEVKERLQMAASDQGFLDARFVQHQVLIDRTQNTVEIDLVLDTGPLYYFGDIHFNGSTYDTAFLERYLMFHSGEPYQSTSLLTLQENLTNSVYFRQVSVHPTDREFNNQYVPIMIDLMERKSKHYTFGAGYGTDTSLRGIGGFDWYHVNDQGHYIESYAELSEVQSTLQARYIIPGINPVIDQYYLGVDTAQQHMNHNQGDTQKISLGRIDQCYEWQRTFGLAYQFDHYRLNDAPFEQTHLLVPSVGLQRSHLDTVIFPRRGYGLSVNTLGSIRALASSSSFIQGAVDAQWVWSPFDQSRLLFRGNLGATITDDIDRVPLSLQFFAGGAQSVRGYDYQELGPGKYLIVGSIEYQQRLVGKWWGAAFFDAGNAISSFTNQAGNFVGLRWPSSIQLAQVLKTSAGLGLVYISPVGPIELTLAKPLSDTNRPIKLQFVMGANL